MKILHTSDLHGRYKQLLALDFDFDVWVDTGDFMPNKGRAWGHRIKPEVERPYQIRWCRYKNIGRRLGEWLNGRPAVVVSGNHDFISIAAAMQPFADVHLATPQGFELLGLKWAGFRHIPYIDGEWPGEVEDWELHEQVEATWKSGPDILVTHAPPSGILSGPIEKKYGISSLTTHLAYRDHKIKAHFFGHEHSDGGQVREEMGVYFANGATSAQVHDLSDRL